MSILLLVHNRPHLRVTVHQLPPLLVHSRPHLRVSVPLVHPLALHNRPHLRVHVPLMMLRLVHANVIRLLLHPPTTTTHMPPSTRCHLKSTPATPICPNSSTSPLLPTLPPLTTTHLPPFTRCHLESTPATPICPSSSTLPTSPDSAPAALSITWPHSYHIVLPPLHSPALICFTCRQ
jgi:hypothetical protein